MSRTDSRHWASCIASEQDVVVFPVERVGRGWLPSSEVTHRRRPFRLCVVLVGDAESEKRRRTHRLLSTLKMNHGKGREFKKPPPLTMEVIKDGHLQLLLSAERARAYAQDLIAQSTLPANDAHDAGTARHSATGRFRRAVHWSTQLLSHCQGLYAAGRLPAEHVIQATVYTLVMNGRFLRYRDDFEDSLVQLSVARDLLDQLAERAVTNRDQALATLFADGIGPEIMLGREKAYDVDAIVVELARKHRSEIVDGCEAILQKKKLETPMWEGQPILVRNPELVNVLLRVQEAEAKIAAPREAGENIGTGDNRKHKKRLGSKKGVAAYGAILSALSITNNTATSAAATRDIQFVHAYIQDLLLVSTLLSSHPPSGQGVVSKGKEQVDSSLSIVDESPDQASAVEARVTFTRARRCSYLAQCYIVVYSIHDCWHLGDVSYPLPPGTVDGLEIFISETSLSVKNEWFAYNGGKVDGDPKAYRPLFFDIALNYVQLDMDRLLERAGKSPSKPKEGEREIQVQPAKSRLEEITRTETPEPPTLRGGLSSLLGGWWGRKR
ncbi:hypothetical protein SCLCIDRAFT_18400 [Scleroderma citrinum Foug A]|uniref:Signal recognition particle subunit SRP68 n=1 Tax=Scleroderma citrinum Foug A TaxID=1036808 RepID=A0A0C3D5W7_9AGAM|nr:hypothetical protein SCLCIDRAFT_18400 [Scleroderma citrinum Foug A]